MQHGACTIIPTKINFSSEELVDMIFRCGLNRLHQFASFLSVHIRHSRHNPKLLAYLQNLDIIITSGLPLPQEDEEFAYQNKLNLVVSDTINYDNALFLIIDFTNRIFLGVQNAEL